LNQKKVFQFSYGGGFLNPETLFSITELGKVGIGEGLVDPSERLTVSGNIALTGNLLIASSKALVSHQEVLSFTVSVNVILATAAATYRGVFFDYVIWGSLGQRTGTLMASYDAVHGLEFTDTSTLAMGNMDGIVLRANYSSGVQLLADVATGTWNIKVMVRGI